MGSVHSNEANSIEQVNALARKLATPSGKGKWLIYNPTIGSIETTKANGCLSRLWRTLFGLNAHEKEEYKKLAEGMRKLVSNTLESYQKLPLKEKEQILKNLNVIIEKIAKINAFSKVSGSEKIINEFAVQITQARTELTTKVSEDVDEKAKFEAAEVTPQVAPERSKEITELVEVCNETFPSLPALLHHGEGYWNLNLYTNMMRNELKLLELNKGKFLDNEHEARTIFLIVWGKANDVEPHKMLMETISEKYNIQAIDDYDELLLSLCTSYKDGHFGMEGLMLSIDVFMPLATPPSPTTSYSSSDQDFYKDKDTSDPVLLPLTDNDINFDKIAADNRNDTP